MKELIQRLSALDEDATAAVKIILHFDTLLGQGAGLESFVRGAAVLSGHPAGMAHPRHRLSLRVEADGRPAPPGGGPRRDREVAAPDAGRRLGWRRLGGA